MIGVLLRKTRAGIDVLRATIAVRRARRIVADTPVGSLVQPDAPSAATETATSLAAAERHVAERWGSAVDRALRWTPGDSACLVRASALRELVASRGLPRATVRIGVRRQGDGLEAHAWVEQDGVPIAEPVILRGAFASLDGVTLRDPGRQ